MKNEKGMTLVALVLTIIVLLILAAVAIYMVVGPDGVLKASSKNEISSENTVNNTAVENNINE